MSGVAADGVTAVDVRLRDGSSVAAPVTENAFLFHTVAVPVEVTWTADGRDEAFRFDPSRLQP